MDGEAIFATFGASPGHDCLKDVLPKFGQRIKVYCSLKKATGDALHEVLLLFVIAVYGMINFRIFKLLRMKLKVVL